MSFLHSNMLLNGFQSLKFSIFWKIFNSLKSHFHSKCFSFLNWASKCFSFLSWASPAKSVSDGATVLKQISYPAWWSPCISIWDPLEEDLMENSGVGPASKFCYHMVMSIHFLDKLFSFSPTFHSNVMIFTGLT